MKKEKNIKKLAIIISKNGLEEVLPGLIMANGARMEGIEVMLFFTFFGLDAVLNEKMDKLEVAKSYGSFTTESFKKMMEKYDIPSVREFIEMIHDFGGKIYACKASADLWGVNEKDFCPEVDGIISVGQFYTLSDDAQHIIYT